MELPQFYAHKANDDMSDNGPRTAAVLTFSGDSNDSVVKELTQNSLDAREDRGGELFIKVNCNDILKSDIPNFDQFETTLDSMELYWNKNSDQYKRFFKTAKKSIQGSTVKVFVFEDFKTLGLSGNDYQGTFKNCVNDENVSGKDYSDSLGNHGIGKNAVFGYSGVHTVFYSSLNKKGEHKFKGVSKLGNFVDTSGVKRAERVYYGKKEGEGIRLVQDENAIPSVFRRNIAGLSQYVIASELEEEWSDNIRRAFIENYWFLFESNKLSVEIDGQILNKDNYEEEALLLFKEDKSKDNPLPYIRAYKTGEIFKERSIYKIGNVKLYLLEAEEEDIFPNKVMFLRDGMKIKMDNLNVGGLPVNISGVMFCDNIEGNSILGAMEPHAHNDFIPELVSKKQISNVSVEDAKRVLSELKKFKTDELKELKKKYTQEAASVDIVDELFSKVLGISSGRGTGHSTPTKEESFNKKITQIDLDGLFSTNSRNAIVNNNADTDAGDGDGHGQGTGKGGTKNQTGTGQGKGPNEGGADKSSNKIKGPIKHNITSRFFMSKKKSSGNVYKMIIRSVDDIDSFDIVFSQQGDSGVGGTMSSKLVSVKSENKPLEFKGIYNTNNEITSYRINGLKTKEEQAQVYEIELEERTLSALTIIETI